MKNTPIRLIVVLGALSLLGIVITQVFWVSKAIKNQEQQFSHSVQMAMRSAVESLCEANGFDFDHDPIEQVSNNYFIARANSRINLTSLDYLLKSEFEKRNLKQDFEFGVYDCQTDRMVYGKFVSFGEDAAQPIGRLPKLDKEEYYLGVYFPSREPGLVNELGIWKFTSILTVIIVLFFGYALFVILKQKRLSEIQRDFINNMTHELKTPLATLKLSAEVIGQEVTSERGKKYASIVAQESEKLQKQVSTILENALNETGTSQEKPSAIDIHAVLAETVDRFSNAKVVWDLSTGFSPRMWGAKGLFEKVIFNLIDNAVKYGNGAVQIKTESVGTRVILTISNQGKVIPKKDQARIFDKFYRVSTGNTHDVKGFGLGLYFVKTALPRLKGKISLQSDEENTTFTLTFPISNRL